MNISRSVTYIFLCFLILFFSGCSLFLKQEIIGGKKENIRVDNFNDCASIGNPIMESYPRQCRYGDKNYTENIGNELEKMDLIRLNNPRPNQLISSPLKIEGEARGNWFFEASFPVVLTDWDGLIIADGIATVKTDVSTGLTPSWMTEDFVPFEATLKFDKPNLYNNGSLILQKDNPSGLPEHDDALEIPIYFE